MNIRYVLVIVAALACSTFDVAPAQAQCGMYGGYGFGAWDVGRLYGVLAQNVPYYAAFPPVYYSAPVPRTYGYSPFAYPPGYTTPEIVESPQAVEISNPFVKPTGVEAPKQNSDKVTKAESAKPLLVMNPFVGEVVALD